MKGYYYLNFSDLSEDAQSRLIQDSIEDLEGEYGKTILEQEAQEMNIDYDTFIIERAERHMCSFDFIFNI